MSRQIRAPLTWALIVLVATTGCHPTQPFYFHEDGDLSHYLDKATDVEHPDVDFPHLGEVENAHSPLTVSNPEFNEIWDLTLQDAVQISLQNSKVVRNAGAIQANFGFSDALIERVPGFTTSYDPAIAESNVVTGAAQVNANPGQGGFSPNGFGELSAGTGGGAARASTQGMADALSDFDAQFTSGFNFTTTDRPNNLGSVSGPFQARVLQDHTSNFGMGLSKKTATGTVFTLRNVTTFNWNNTPPTNRGVPGDWITSVEAVAQIPILRGRGTQINRLPIVLARINTDISIADFEAGVRNMLMDVETAYWDLHFSYRNLEATKIGRDSALVTWKIVYEKWSKGVSPVQEEAQARGQYFQFRAGVEAALRDVYNTETRLRWLMGLAATDGRLIRPKDEPSMARVDFDWQQIHCEAMFRSVELRQHKWRLKQRELELISAKNQLLPQFNISTLYRWLGRGDELMNADRNGLDFPSPGSTAVDELFGGQYTEAGIFAQFIPARIGMRRELAGVRNAQLQIARTKAQLEEMELNLSHLLTSSIRDLDSNYILAQSHFNRWVAAEKEVESVQALYEGGKQTLDLVLDAQRRRATAQSDYYRAITDYNKSLAFVHYRKGSLLEHNGIGMQEGPWPDKAYWDAIGHARERDASYYLNYGWTRPKVVSQGPVEQFTGNSEPRGKENGEQVESSDPTTVSPTPMPTEDTPKSPMGPTASNGSRGMGTNLVRRASAEVPVEAFDWGSIGKSAAPVTSTPSTGTKTSDDSAAASNRRVR